MPALSEARENPGSEVLAHFHRELMKSAQSLEEENRGSGCRVERTGVCGEVKWGREEGGSRCISFTGTLLLVRVWVCACTYSGDQQTGASSSESGQPKWDGNTHITK